MLHDKALKKCIAGALSSVIVFIFVICFFPQKAYAYTSWVQGTEAYEELYGEDNLLTEEETDSMDAEAEEPKESFVAQQLGAVIYGLGYWITRLSTKGKINLSIDGIVFGKLNQKSGINYFGFDLSPGNPYGIVGATVYTIFRGLCYSGLFILFLYMLAKTLFSTSSKAREELKNGVYGILIAFALMYLMPQIADLVVFIRDSLVLRVARSISKGSVSILLSLNDLYQNGDNDLISAICFTALAAACLFYARDYISIALQQTVLFGLFPVFNLLGADKKKFLSDWCMTFFSNMLVPLIDSVLLIMPYTVIKNMSEDGTPTITFVEGAIIVLMIWGSRTARSQTLKLFGNATNSPAGRGLMGLAQMAQMARMSARMGRNIAANATTGSAGSDSYSGWKDEEIGSSMSGADMNREAAEVSGSLSDLDGELDSVRKTEEADIAKDNTALGANFDDEYSVGGGSSDEDEAGVITGDAAEDAGADITAAYRADLPEDGMSETTGSEGFEGNDIGEDGGDFTRPDGLFPENFETARLNNLESIDNSTKELEELTKRSELIESRLQEAQENSVANGVTPNGRPVRQIEDIEKENLSIDKRLDVEKRRKAKSDNLDRIEYETYKKAGNKEGCASVMQRINERQQKFDESQDALKARKSQNLEDIKRMNTGQDKASAEKINALRIKNEEITARREALKQEISRRQSAERQYAQIAASHGMGDKTYKNAQEMKINQMIMDNRVKTLKERSVISREDLKGLSPEARSEIARIQKENIRKRNLKKAIMGGAVSVAGAAAATTAATLGAVVGAYGGEDGSLQGAMLGYYGATAMGNRAKRAARFVSSNRAEIAENAKNGAKAVKDTAKKVTEAAHK